MKKNLLAFSFLFILFVFSCGNEADAPLGNFNTFIRYIGTGSNEIAAQVKELSGGNIALLSNTEIPTSEIGRFRYKATLTLTDQFGNKTWDIRYPAFGANGSFKGNSFSTLPNGNFLIVGENINSNNQSNLMLVEISSDGILLSTHSFDNPNTFNALASVKGYGITLNSTNDFLVLSNVTNNGTQQVNMLLQLINASTREIEWSYAYGSDPGTITRRLFINSNNIVVWGGTKINNQQSDFRLVAAPKNSQSTVFDLSMGLPDKNEEGMDICKFLNGFAMVGRTNNTIDGTTNVLLTRTTEDGAFLSETSFGRTENDTGKAITATRDASLVVFANTEVTNIINNYYLVKLDSFGNIIWERLIGSSHNDDAVDVVEASDGGFILCGTTDFGGSKKAMLMKVNSEGNLL